MNKKLAFLTIIGVVVPGTTGCMEIAGFEQDYHLRGLCTEQPSVVAYSQEGANYIAVDATNLYWTNRVAGEVVKMGIDDRLVTPFQIPKQVQPRCIAVDATTVYWTNIGDGTDNMVTGGSVMKVNIDGSNFTTIATGQNNPYDIAVDGAYVYWTNEGPSLDYAFGTLMRRKLDLSNDPEVFAHDQTYPQAVAVDENGVYWTSVDKIKKAPLSGPIDGVGAVTLATSPPPDVTPGRPTTHFSRIAIRDKTVYWTDTDSNTVNRVGTGGANPKQIAANTLSPFGIAVDETNVYWTSSFDKLVSKVGIDGGEVTTIATEQAYPVGIAVDKTCIYWANYIDGTVMKVAK